MTAAVFAVTATLTAPVLADQVIMKNGEYTGAVPGTLIRGTQPAPSQAA